MDECSSHPCQNGGMCLDLINKYECQCVAGYQGYLCETGNLFLISYYSAIDIYHLLMYVAMLVMASLRIIYVFNGLDVFSF
jgi:hypothetical protein